LDDAYVISVSPEPSSRAAQEVETMDRIERIRGKLLAGNQIIVDPIEGQLRSRPRPNGPKGDWSGHLDLPPEICGNIDHGARYRLLLTDGRSGDIYVHVGEVDALGRCQADFHGNGLVRK